ncbi:hypothetical protein BSR29_04305 [Boudabousia liubingyangii]|uniref:Leucine rich repeat variant domain-containing protein n=1 Tax=Boudabousia liubingyangii TaxID=1921764 RepID=A0A1Q5PNQ4_9ACTO|nr:hypothetical protein [Boudabousia liubingyangii]OKL49060.1 hypothetical protein BSR29_04305 [Boudabousia liubingyangii]
MSMPPNSQNSLPGGNGSDPTAQLLRDPNLDPSILAQIVNSRRDLWLQVAMHPRIYPELLHYLAEKGDPQTAQYARLALQVQQGIPAPTAAMASSTAEGKNDQQIAGNQVHDGQQSSLPSYQQANVAAGTQDVSQPKRKKTWWIAAGVAVILTVTGIGGYFLLSNNQQSASPYLSVAEMSSDFLTGKVEVIDAESPKFPGEFSKDSAHIWTVETSPDKKQVLMGVEGVGQESKSDFITYVVYDVAALRKGEGPRAMTPDNFNVSVARLLDSNQIQVVRLVDGKQKLETYDLDNFDKPLESIEFKFANPSNEEHRKHCWLSPIYPSQKQYLSCEYKGVVVFDHKSGDFQNYDTMATHVFRSSSEPNYLLLSDSTSAKIYPLNDRVKARRLEGAERLYGHSYLFIASDGSSQISNFKLDAEGNNLTELEEVFADEFNKPGLTKASPQEMANSLKLMPEEERKDLKDTFLLPGERIVRFDRSRLEHKASADNIFFANDRILFTTRLDPSKDVMLICEGYEKQGNVEMCLDKEGKPASKLVPFNHPAVLFKKPVDENGRDLTRGVVIDQNTAFMAQVEENKVRLAIAETAK